MSKHHYETITCPECGKESQFLVWESINTVIDPDMKTKVRSGEAFRWHCPSCDAESDVEYACLYHQMEDHVMIYFVPGDATKAVEFMQMEGDPIISPYAPTPTIIEAARSLYESHSVENITRHEADQIYTDRTISYILDVIRESKEQRKKSICFVTGVP